MNARIRKYLSKIGAIGGKSRSEAKCAAVRINGRLGGRPSKSKKEKKVHPKNNYERVDDG